MTQPHTKPTSRESKRLSGDCDKIPTFFQKNRTTLLIGGPVTTTGLTFSVTSILCATLPSAAANITALLPFFLPLPHLLAALAFAAILAGLALLISVIIAVAVASLNPPASAQLKQTAAF